MRNEQAIWGAGAVVPALAASLSWICCLPILGGAVGAMAGTLGAAFMPFRPYLAAVAMVALAAGFWKAYRPAPACGPEGSCKAPVSRTAQRAILWVAAMVVVGLLTIPSWSSWIIYWTL